MASLGSWEKSVIHQLRRLYSVLSEALDALAKRKVTPSFLDSTNVYVDGYVPSKAAGVDQFTWVAGGGGGGVSSVSSGTGIDVDNTDSSNPIVNVTDTFRRTAITFGWDGAGVPLLAGQVLRGVSKYPATLTDVTVISDVSGSCVVDIWKDTFANYPPNAADSITGSTPPSLSSSDKSYDSSLTGWDKTVLENDTFICRIDSISGGITQLNVTLGGNRT